MAATLTAGRSPHFLPPRSRHHDLDDAGYRVRRFTWHKIRREPDEVARQVRSLLKIGSAS